MATLPPALIEVVRQQTGIPFLGAGASIGAIHPGGQRIPKGSDLRDMISDRFLGGQLKNKTLMAVAEIAANETSLNEVQSFVSSIFSPYSPAQFQLLIARFRWRALVTTNLDLLVEKSFEANPSGQKPVVFIKDTDSFDRQLRATTDPLELIKLHGSIDAPNDKEAPFILGQEQYATHDVNRKRLYSRVRDLFHEYPVIFCGYSLEDPHIQNMIFSFTDSGIDRPGYYAVGPDMSDMEVRYWGKHRVFSVKATYEEFLTDLDRAIAPHARSLSATLGGGTSSLRRFYVRANAAESPYFLQALQNDVTHVTLGMKISSQDPKRFYKGYDDGWGGIAADLDAPRRVTDSIIVDTILTDEADRKLVELFLVRGPAGQGKTIALKRVAWEAAHNYDKLVLFHRTNGALNPDFFQEVHSITQRRIFLLVDRLIFFREEVASLMRAAAERRIPITIIGATRNNDWEMFGDYLQTLVTQEFTIPRLSELEATRLIDLLERHQALGVLEVLPKDARLAQFMKRAERQLLVALHEATLGKRFEDIIQEEYAEIPSPEAKAVYFKICCLHQFGAPVRAGLIHRVTGVSFEDFQQRLLKPLKDIVYIGQDYYSGDYTYRARHEHVAEIVFISSTRDEEERYHSLAELISEMNTSYSSDRETFNRLLRGRAIAKMFTDVNLGRLLFEHAIEREQSNPFIMQQRAIFEMHHDSGSLDVAEANAVTAGQLVPHSRSVANTHAEILRRKARLARTEIEKDAIRKAARTKLSFTGVRSEYDFQTAVRIYLDEFREKTKQPNSANRDRDILSIADSIERLLNQAKQAFPTSQHLAVLESEYMDVIDEDDKATKILEKAFAINKRLEWVAIRLANRHRREKHLNDAVDVLKKCLAENPRAKLANLHLGHALAAANAPDATVLEHYRLSFTEGDNNFDSLFWYARQAFLTKDSPTSIKAFNDLNARAPAGFRLNTGEPIEGSHGARRFDGTVARKGDAYSFIYCTEFGMELYAHAGDSEPDNWVAINSLDKVTFEIGFNRRGPRVVSLERRR